MQVGADSSRYLSRKSRLLRWQRGYQGKSKEILRPEQRGYRNKEGLH